MAADCMLIHIALKSALFYLWLYGFSPLLLFAARRDRVFTGVGKNAETGLVASGVPPYQQLASSLTQVQRMLADSTSDHVEALGDLREEFAALAGDMRAEVLRSINHLQDELPKAVCDMVLKHVQVEGAQPLLQSDLQHMFAEHSQRMLAAMQAQFVAALPQPPPAAPIALLPPPDAVPLHPPGAEDEYPMYQWGGKLHYFPDGWAFTQYVCSKYVLILIPCCQLI